MKIRVIRENEKTYLAELIGNDFTGWKGKKVLISAPTGMGKSTFVVKILLDYVKERKRRLLILCNRRLLRLQYWYTIVKRFTGYAEIEECVKIMTYQELTELMKRQVPLEKVLNGFETVVSDECHYFYSDSDFNGYGTYALLQEIACAGATKTLIFMSATMEEVKPLITQTLKNCLHRLELTGRNTEIRNINAEILEYDFSEFADYERFQCVCVPDWETLCEMLAESSKKTVIFLNNKEKGIGLAEKLVKTGKVEKTEIIVLNADNIDGNSEVIQHLAISHKLIPKILITTAVLDNGVSIQDAEIGNVVIETESKIEFLQMLGRVRSESVENCKLYFVQRDGKDFLNRKNRYEVEMERLKKLTTGELRAKREFYIQSMWDGDEMAEFYRKVLVWMKFDSQFYQWPENETIALNRKTDFYVNEFAKRKIGDMYAAESRFYALALEDPLQVVYEQMSWIGKNSGELQVLESEYRKMKEQNFVKELLAVQNFTADDLKEVKKKFVKDYRKELFPDILANNGTIANDKLQTICGRYGLKLLSWEDVENRRKLYSIKVNNQEGEV